MKTGLWIIIVIVVGFLGFLVGFSTPPFIHSGVLTTEGVTVEPGTEMDQEMEQYYKDLLKEEE